MELKPCGVQECFCSASDNQAKQWFVKSSQDPALSSQGEKHISTLFKGNDLLETTLGKILATYLTLGIRFPPMKSKRGDFFSKRRKTQNHFSSVLVVSEEEKNQ